MPLSTEMLIETVKKHPALYDTSHGDYKTNRVKNKIWHDIAEEFGKKNGEILKKQWKNLRDAYSKHLRSLKPSAESSKFVDRYRSWPWAKLMGFLRPHLEFAETQSLTRNAGRIGLQRNSEEIEPESDVQGNIEDVQSNVTKNEEVDGPSQAMVQQNDIPIERKRAFDRTKDKITKFAREKDDDTDLLFKSYAKKLKKMNMRRQAKVKFEMAKIMLKAELEECDERQSRSDRQYLDHNTMMRHPATETKDSVCIAQPNFDNDDYIEYSPTYMPASPPYAPCNPPSTTNFDDAQSPFARRHYKEEIDIEITKVM